jgi:hypothetical protein
MNIGRVLLTTVIMFILLVAYGCSEDSPVSGGGGGRGGGGGGDDCDPSDRVRLYVESNQPGGEVTVSPADVNGKSLVKTPAVLTYCKDTAVSIQAQGSIKIAGVSAEFVRWCPLNISSKKVEITLNEDQTITAIYPEYDSRRPSDITDYCTLRFLWEGKGDRDFDGDGPCVSLDLRIGKGTGARTIEANLYMRAWESDGGKTSGRVEKRWTLVNLDRGYTVDKIIGPTSHLSRILYTDSDGDLDCFTNPCSMLRRICVNGDTGGPDVSFSFDLCFQDRTYAQLYWNDIQFLKIPPPCN